jgi:hypothetical protein
MQTTNIDSELLARNPALINAGTVDKNWDFNPGFGGPIKRDKIWFFASGRSQGAYVLAPGMFFNKNANDPTKWTYDPDLAQPASLEKTWLDAQARVSWQANQKNKIGFTYTQQDFCACHDAITATTAPEAAYDRRFPTQRVILLDWTSPLTNKVLLEGSAIHRVERWGNMHLQTKDFSTDPDMIAVTDQAANVPDLGVVANLNYRARGGANANNNSWNENLHYRFNVSYITGAHAFKFGMNNAHGYHENQSYQTNTLAYRFNNGVPNQLTMRALPHTIKNNVDQDLGLFAQDKWTIDRLTVSLGIRFDYHANSFPEQTLGPTRFTPNRNLTFPEQDNVSYKDFTPKSQVVYDLFGNGRTALKVSINKYLTGLGTTNGVTPVTLGPNPINTLNTSVNRSWTDGNRNYIADCDLLNPLAQNNLAAGGDSCGAFDDATFGRPTPNTVFDPELLNGWGKRYYNWEFSTGVQHEILPRVSLDVGYFRRWYGNFVVQDNRAVSAADYETFSIVAPADPRLPDGGGYTIPGFRTVSQAGFGRAADNFTTLADNYGKQISHWNGVDVSANARLRNGVFIQGGTSTGRTSTDNCEILAVLPEISPSGVPYCHQDANWLTQFKGAASYTVPRIDVGLSGTFQLLPGPDIDANWAAPNSAISPSLGHNLAGGVATQTVNLVTPNTLYNDSLTQLDLRVAKIFRMGTTRATINFDLYNVTNSNTILTLNNGFVPSTTGGLATWQIPTAILQPRFWKIGAQFDF